MAHDGSRVVLLAVCVATIGGRTQAQPVTLIATRGAIPSAHIVDWAQLGPAGTQVPQPFIALTDRGYPFFVLKNNSPTPYIRADQGNGFVGDFLPNERLLYSTSDTAFDMRFNPPIMAIGAQLQLSESFDWTPFIRAYTSNGQEWSFTLSPDVNNGAADGSAPFVGVSSPIPNITRVLFDSFNGGNTAINHLSLSVPEPNTLLLIALCGVGPATSAFRRFAGHRFARDR